jgi:3-oxoacyl-(acyl-carrier-protein) synthase
LLVVHRLLEKVTDLGDPEQVGVILGTSLGCASVNDAYHRSALPPVSRPSPVLFGYTVPSAPVGEVATTFGLRGHQLVVMAGACSGLAAAAEARSALACRRAEAIVLLASDVLSLDRVDLLHQQGSPPPVEATVALLLERPEHAVVRGRVPLAELAELRRELGETTPAAPFTYLGATGLVELACSILGDFSQVQARSG